jgi:hypothetical protein
LVLEKCLRHTDDGQEFLVNTLNRLESTSMKRMVFLATLALIGGVCLLNAQGIQHPWWVVGRGGGESSAPGGFGLIGSFGQTAVQKMMQSDTGLVLESGYVPGIRNLSGTATVMTLPVSGGWNMVSVPLMVTPRPYLPRTGMRVGTKMRIHWRMAQGIG